jgi:hypothetical protein
LYASVLEAVENLERRGVTVLVGGMLDPEPDANNYKTAVVSITPRKMDPGAIKGGSCLSIPAFQRRIGFGIGSLRPAKKCLLAWSIPDRP